GKGHVDRSGAQLLAWQPSIGRGLVGSQCKGRKQSVGSGVNRYALDHHRHSSHLVGAWPGDKSGRRRLAASAACDRHHPGDRAARDRPSTSLIGSAKEDAMEERTRSAGAGDDNDSRFDRAKEYVSDTASAASDAVKNQYNRVRERVEDADIGAMMDQVRSYVRSNPGKALLISVGVGFLVGLLLRRDEGDED